MTTRELIEELKQKYGNPLAPTQYRLIQQAIIEMERMADELESVL